MANTFFEKINGNLSNYEVIEFLTLLAPLSNEKKVKNERKISKQIVHLPSILILIQTCSSLGFLTLVNPFCFTRECRTKISFR